MGNDIFTLLSNISEDLLWNLVTPGEYNSAITYQRFLHFPRMEKVVDIVHGKYIALDFIFLHKFHLNSYVHQTISGLYLSSQICETIILLFVGSYLLYVDFAFKLDSLLLPARVDITIGVLLFKECISVWIRYAFKKKIRDFLGIFPNMGGGLPNSQNSKPKKKCP